MNCKWSLRVHSDGLNSQGISNPKDEAKQDAAWDAVCPLVGKLKSFWDYSMEVEAILPVLLAGLCTEAPEETLATKQVCTTTQAA
jgi:hypothetical protein